MLVTSVGNGVNEETTNWLWLYAFQANVCQQDNTAYTAVLSCCRWKFDSCFILIFAVSQQVSAYSTHFRTKTQHTLTIMWR